MIFESYGGFDLPRTRTGHWRRAFWEDVEAADDGLSNSIGCYVFCLKTKLAVKPWYIGKTISKDGFRSEVFTPHKLSHYDEIMQPTIEGVLRRNGQPSIMLFPLLTENWGFSSNRSNSVDTIEWLETALIGMALSRNPEIANTSKTRFHREIFVNGIIGVQDQGRPSRGASFAKDVFLAKSK